MRNNRHCYFLSMMIAALLLSTVVYGGGRKPLAGISAEMNFCAHGTAALDCSICSILSTGSANYAYSHAKLHEKRTFVLTPQSYDPSEEENTEEEEEPLPEQSDPDEFPWGWIVAGTWLLWFIAKGNNKA